MRRAANFTDGFILAFHSRVRFGLSKRNAPTSVYPAAFAALAWMQLDGGEPNRMKYGCGVIESSWLVEPSAGISDKSRLHSLTPILAKQKRKLVKSPVNAN